MADENDKQLIPDDNEPDPNIIEAEYHPSPQHNPPPRYGNMQQPQPTGGPMFNAPPAPPPPPLEPVQPFGGPMYSAPPPGMPPAGAVPPPPQKPPQIIVQNMGGRWIPFWIMTSVIAGVLLPICSCLALLLITMIGTESLVDSLAEFDPAQDTGTGPGIGVVEIEGPIYQGEGIGAGSEQVIQDIEWMNDNNDVKAIVLLMNSPGGDANASDLIWREVQQSEKPVYVAINGLCASGCYYIAMGATKDKIYATPNSLVGSIGVISYFFNVDELLDELGVDVEVVATGENKDFGSPFRDMTEEERAHWEQQIDETYNNFIAVVVNGRSNHLTENEVRTLADGDVWAVDLAIANGLVDGEMYPEEVLDLAAQDTGLGSDYRVIESPFEPTFFDLLFAQDPLFGMDASIELPDARDLENLFQQSPIQYRYFGPYGGSLPED